jgi:D-psicose/D-tagatose/L-ribulose 3-epimerase
MTFGINLFLWTTTMSEESELRKTLLFLKETGYDFVEIPVSVTDIDFWERWKKYLDEIGLQRVCCSITGPEFSLISANENIRQAGIDRLKAVIDSTHAVGATMLTGPYHSGFCEFTGKPATPQDWQRSVTAMQEIAAYAQTKNVILGVEYLNRFENYLLTSTEELIRYVTDVNHPHCQLMFDTFHANIEEKSMITAIQNAAKHLVHVQVSENDRSTIGQGRVEFEEVFAALQSIGYDATISVEAFGLTPADLAAGAHIYRKMFDSPEQLATDSLKYLKKMTRK